MKISHALATAAVALSAFGTAHADQTWNFSYTGEGVTASGSFVTAGSALVLEDILSITGQRNGEAITGLVAVDTDPDFLYDNQFTIGEPHFTDGGMLFSVPSLPRNVNVYFFEGSYFEVGADRLSEAPINFSVSAAVPEPATVLSMMAGLGLLGLRLRQQRR